MTIIEEIEETRPPRWAFWVLAAILLVAYLGLQFVFVLPVTIWQTDLGAIKSQEDLMNSEPVLLAGLIGVGAAGLIVALIVWLWPVVWARIRSTDPVDWVGWRAPKYLKLWQIVLITVAFLVIVSQLIGLLLGDAEVELQVQLFSSMILQIVAVPVVGLIVPFAEEFIFRGALYKALLPPGGSDPIRDLSQDWRDHLLPFLVTSVAFALIHLAADFKSAASIVMVTLLSLMLSGFRAITGSVQASIAGHMIWNLMAAISLIAVNLVNF